MLSLASLIGVLTVAIAVLALYASFDKEDAFFLSSAELADADYLRDFRPGNPTTAADEEQLVAYSHRLKQGRGSIFADRSYSNGLLNVIDDETYRKVTIWIAAPPPSMPVRIDLGDSSTVVAVFTNGGSAWPRAGCAGYLAPGTVKITPNGRSYVVDVDAQLTPIATAATLPRCPPRVRLAFRASSLAWEGLTPWLGKRGAHPYDETYR